MNCSPAQCPGFGSFPAIFLGLGAGAQRTGSTRPLCWKCNQAGPEVQLLQTETRTGARTAAVRPASPTGGTDPRVAAVFHRSGATMPSLGGRGADEVRRPGAGHLLWAPWFFLHRITGAQAMRFDLAPPFRPHACIRGKNRGNSVTNWAYFGDYQSRLSKAYRKMTEMRWLPGPIPRPRDGT